MLEARARAASTCAERTRIFLEANPEDVTRGAVAAWRRLGVDTLSLGVQALDPDGARVPRARATTSTTRAARSSGPARPASRPCRST